MRVVVLSDTHMLHEQVEIPDGDMLIHAGDFSASRGGLATMSAFNDFMAGLPHRHKVVIAGNHDIALQSHPEEARRCLSAVTYLQDELLEVEGLRIWGSPWQPRFFDYAFGLSRGAALAEKWARIPSNLDILVTHTPPFGVLDQVRLGRHVGCEALVEAVQRVRPRFHVFGHIHEGYGRCVQDGVCFVNASVCDVFGGAVNLGWVLEV